MAEFLRKKRFIFGVGLEKCGTTSFSEFLTYSKEVSVPIPKELEFFSSNYDKGFDWYLSHYDLTREVLLDFTPSYHWKQITVERITKTSENHVVVLMLRNPVERAYSAYVHTLYWFFEKDFANGNIKGYDASFSDMVLLGNGFIFPSYLNIIKRLNDALLPSNALIIPLEKFITGPSHYLTLMEDMLGTQITLQKNASVPKSNALMIPQFFTGREIIGKCEGAEGLIDEVDAVYFCRGGMPTKIAGLDLYPALKEMESKWMQPLDPDTANLAFKKYYKEETEQFEKFIGTELDEWRKVVERRPKTAAPLSDEAACGNSDMAIWIARRIFLAGEHKRAIAYIRNAIEREPTVAAYYRTLAWMLLESGYLGEAGKAAQKALNLSPTTLEYHLFYRYVSNRVAAARFLCIGEQIPLAL